MSFFVYLKFDFKISQKEVCVNTVAIRVAHSLFIALAQNLHYNVYMKLISMYKYALLYSIYAS